MMPEKITEILSRRNVNTCSWRWLARGSPCTKSRPARRSQDALAVACRGWVRAWGAPCCSLAERPRSQPSPGWAAGPPGAGRAGHGHLSEPRTPAAWLQPHVGGELATPAGSAALKAQEPRSGSFFAFSL